MNTTNNSTTIMLRFFRLVRDRKRRDENEDETSVRSKVTNSKDKRRRMRQNSKKHVHFGHVEVRHYEMILGDHPACSYGTPVTLGWTYEQEPPAALEIFEEEATMKRQHCNGSSYCGPRSFLLNSYQRRDILLAAGYTNADIKHAARQVQKVQRQRALTRALLPVSRMNELMLVSDNQTTSSSSPLSSLENNKKSLRRNARRLLQRQAAFFDDSGSAEHDDKENDSECDNDDNSKLVNYDHLELEHSDEEEGSAKDVAEDRIARDACGTNQALSADL